MSSPAVAGRAAEALRLVQADPTRAAPLARSALEAATASGDEQAASVAERALGLAALHLDDLPTAVTHLRYAVHHGRSAGSPQLVAESRMSLAYVLGLGGAPRRAVREIDAALGDLDAAGRARALAQRGAIHQQQGRLEAALTDYRHALPALRRADDAVWVQRVLSNRGVLHAFRHEYGLAARDLEEARRVCEGHGLTLQAAFVEENLLLVTRRVGDIPGSLRHLSRAESLYRDVGAPLGSVLVERSELLLSVRLFAEAREAAESAVAELERAQRRLGLSEARLLLARAAIMDGEPLLAVAQASRAVHEFRLQGRAEWVALARCGLLIARSRTAERPPSVRRLAEAAAAAERHGWPGTAAEVRLLAARSGLGGREHPAAVRELELVARGRHHGPAARRITAWYAVALLRSASGDRYGADRAAVCGLRVIEEHRGTIAATDVRAGLSGLGVGLARIGLRGAVESGSARQVLTWAERGRARLLGERPGLPPDDREVGRLLAELRATVAEIGERRVAGLPVGRQVQQQVGLERAIRDATRRAGAGASRRAGARGGIGAGPGGSLGSPDGGGSPCGVASAPAGPTSRDGVRPSVGDLPAVLGPVALLEYVELDGSLHVVTVVDGRFRRVALGPVEPVRALVRWLPFALHRLSRSGAHGGRPAAATAASAGRDSAVAVLRHAAERLDDILLAPIRRAVGDRTVVVVPTGILQSVPWSVLPSMAGRPVTVAPSAALWAAAARREPRPGPVVVAAGLGLRGAAAEAAQIAAIHGIPAPLVGAQATHDAVTTALPGARLAHLGVHGTVRSDNPLFSSLTLADGPLTVYDLERMERGVDTVVIAACDAGRNVVLAGDELLGFSATFLARDTRHVVASVVPIPDAETAPIMVALHRALAAGEPVAAALATAQCGVDAEDPTAVASAAGFVCIGVGSLPVAPAAPAAPAGNPDETVGVRG